MGHVLVELEKLDSTTELTKVSLETIFARCEIDVRFKFIDTIDCSDLDWCDSYIAVRPNTPMSLSLAKAVKVSGRFYTVLFDDDLLNQVGALIWRKKSSKKCIQLADLVIGVNPVLIKEYSKITKSKRYVLLNTPVSEAEYTKLHHMEDKIRFVYAAGRDHAVVFEKLLRPAVHRYLEKYYERAHFTFIGVEPDISGLEHKECFSFVPLMPLKDYNEYMRENTFDVGLAPLEDVPFSNRKYFNKYIEYTKVGITGLYSNCLPFISVVIDNENGILVNNTEQDWLYALEKTTTEHVLIEECAVKAQKMLKEKFSVEGIVKTLQEHVPEFEKFKCDEWIDWKKSNSIKMCFLFLDKTQKLIYHMTHVGLKSTVKLVLSHFNDNKK